MKRIVSTTAVAAAVVALTAAAESMAQVMYEPFDYAEGDVTDTVSNGNSPADGRTNQTQGTFWSRAGAVTATHLLDHDITAGSLTSPAGLPDAIGNKVSAEATSNVDRIGLGQVFQSGRVYYSLLLKFDTTPGAISRVLGLNTFALDGPTNTSQLASAVTTRSAAGGYQVGVAKNSAVAQFDSRVWTTSDTLFVVGAYQINNPSTVGTDDVSYLWINPADTHYGADFSGAEPGPLTDALTTRLTDTAGGDYSDAVGGSVNPAARLPILASFFLRANLGNSLWRVDELRVDSTWAGVTPRKDLQYFWNDAGGGNFADSTKWNNSGGPNPNPNSLGAVAVFGSSITGAATVTTAGETADSITFDNANPVTLGGTGLTISTNASAGQIIAKQGSHTVSAPLTLDDDLAIKAGTDATGTNPATVTLSGAVSGSGRTIGKYGLGTLRLGASNILPDDSTLAVRVGTLDLNGNNETVANVVLGAGHRNSGIDINTSPQLGAGVISGSGSLSATGTFQLENGSVSAVLAGAGAVVKTTQGTVRVSGANTYSGDTIVRAGTLLVGADAPSGAPGALGNSTNPIIISDAGTITGAIDPGGPAIKDGDGVTLLTDGAVTIGRNIVVNPQGHATLGGNTADASTFSGDVTLEREVRLAAVSGGTVTFSGDIANGTGTGSVIKTGDGTVVLSGVNGYTGGNTVSAGTLVSTNGFKAGGPLSIAAGAKAVVPGATPDTYNPPATVPSGSNATGSLITSLAFTGAFTGRLDLGNNDMVIDHNGSSPLTDIRALIASGYNFGAHDGPGIISSTALNTDPFTFALGYGENADLPLPYGTTLGGGPFSDQNPDDTAVLIKFTWIGDVTLDGIFDFQDLSIFNGNYDAGATTGRVWTEGDLNYDGTIDFQDLSLFNGTYDPSKPSLPEPTALTCVAAAALGCVRRRARGR